MFKVAENEPETIPETSAGGAECSNGFVAYGSTRFTSLAISSEPGNGVVTQAGEIRRMYAIPDVVVGSVAALTETGSLVVASASGSQLPSYSGGAARSIWIVGAQKLVPDLPAALRRVEEHCLPLENARALAAYGQPSAINHLLILNAEPYPGRSTVLLLHDAIGF